MRKARLLCALTAASILLCSCSTLKTDETSVSDETEANEEISAEPLTEDILEGLWVDEEGFLCRFDFDDNTFTDHYGALYDIISIDDDSFTVSPAEGSVTPNSIWALPSSDTITVNAVYSDGKLYAFGTEAYSIDSDEGQEVSDIIRDRLAGNTLALAVLGGYLEFNDDMTQATAGSIYGQGETVDIEFTGASILHGYGTGSEESEMIFWMSGDDVIISMDGQVGYATTAQIDYPHRWLYYDAAFESLEILDYTGKSNEFFSEDPLTGERTSIDESIPTLVSSEYLAQIHCDRGEFIQYDDMSGVFICNEVFEQYTDSTTDDTVYLIDMKSPYASMMISRQEVLNSDPGELSEYRVEFPEGYVSINIYENEWPYDYVHLTGEESLYFTDYVDTWEAYPYTDYYYIHIDHSCDEAVIYFQYDGDLAENSYIYCIYENTLIDPVQLDTTYENGMASAVIGDAGYYFLGQLEEVEQMTEENYFDIDPADSSWARNSDTGDILDLVDMEYIEQSHNGVFVVDSVEDLASLTYYVNTYPRDGFDTAFCIWVDLTADIDLTGYEWAPLGMDEYYGMEVPFSGIFAGNGHTISGLNIQNRYQDNGFFGSIFFATVIGLNIEDAVINGGSSNLMAGNVSTTSFYDCHVSGDLINNFAEGDDLFPYWPNYGNNEYFDCSISVVNAADDQYEGDLPNSDPDPNTSNELQDTFDPEHDGTYEYTTDYFFGEMPG